MDVGIFTEFAQAAGMSHTVAFDEAMAEMVAAEQLGYDTVWLGEIHFQNERSVLASPYVIGAAIAARTTRLRIGMAVSILPIQHPLHLAEDAATLDQLSHGRLDLGIGRSGVPEHYRGFGIPYAESRDRFFEILKIMRRAWTEDRFSYEGKYFQIRDICVMPKPYQKPHPPLRVAATIDETYPAVGRMGLPIFLAVRTTSIAHLERNVLSYREAWKAAGHPGEPDVSLIVPVYVSEDRRAARDEPEASMMHFIHNIGDMLAQGSTNRAADGRRLLSITYEEVLKELSIYGTPEEVADRLLQLKETLGYTQLSLWMNSGGQMPHEKVVRSMRLFAERVLPRLR
ncbi:MAG: LLM class flavin-dependent oxidoreductase [Candidatus Rokubacteria bacterium]|nr:LLM class flavin-dependent oxidoreductase [Candidatus Rokubacteria bacterium]